MEQCNINQQNIPKIYKYNVIFVGSFKLFTSTNTTSIQINVIQHDVFFYSNSISFGNIAKNGTSSKSISVPACPTGYSYVPIFKTTGWGTVGTCTLSGTTLTVSVINPSDSNHNISFGFTLIYYKGDLAI